MTKVAITKSLLDDLAASISAKTGETLPLTIAEMTDAVDDISLPSGTKSITANGTGIDVAEYAAVDVAVPQLDTSDANAAASDIRSGKSGYVNGSKVSGSLTSRDSSSLSASGDTVTVPAGIYDAQATKAVSAGTAGTPSATKGTVSNHSVTVTPSVTNTAGYISGGTKNGTAVTVSASELVSGTLYCDDAGTWNVVDAANFVVDAGTVNNPTATKSAVSNHSVSVTPSVTVSEGWIKNTTKTGTAVTVTASELASGNKEITSNGSNIDVVGYSTVSVNVSGGSVSYDTKTTTASDYPTSLSFSSMKGQPKFFAVHMNAQVSSSGSTTYYYIVDIISNGTTTHGNCFRIGSTRRVDQITSGYSWSYSGTTLTITSNAASRSASPGAFYNGSYELMYCY